MDEYLGPKKLNELFADTKVQVYEMDIYVKVRATEYLTNRFLDPIASDVDGCEFFNNYGYYDGRHDGYGDEDEESDDYDNDNYY